MTDLQTAFADDDAFDHQLQDGLLVGECRLMKAGSDALAKCRQVAPDRLDLYPLLAQPIPFLLLMHQAPPLLGEAGAPFGQLVQADGAGLVGIEQAFVSPGGALQTSLESLIGGVPSRRWWNRVVA